MKTAPELIFLFKDADGFGASISDALQPNPNSTLRRLEDSFDLSLERYGIKDYKASGDITHFVDDKGDPQVSILLLHKYEPPILACAINEVIASIAGENESNMPMLILPFFLTASDLKMEGKNSAGSNLVYGIKKGPETELLQALVTRTQKPPSSIQIHHETLSCILQLLHVLNSPAFVLVGQSGLNFSQIASGEDLKVICDMGEILASVLSLKFLREKITWNPTKYSRENKEPWRALYG